jgi:hypothetical protein
MQRGIGQNGRAGWYVQFLAYRTRFLTNFCSTTIVDSCRRCLRYPHHSRHPCRYSLSAASLVFHLIERTRSCGCYALNALNRITRTFFNFIPFISHSSHTLYLTINHPSIQPFEECISRALLPHPILFFHRQLYPSPLRGVGISSRFIVSDERSLGIGI